MLTPGIRAHGTVGRAFVPADARALTGFAENIVGGRTQISQGNPNLKPERSVSFDVGVERTSQASRLDVTYFQTKVTDRVVSNVVISNPAPPAPVVISFVNALSARMRGLEVDYDQRVNGHVGVSASLTHYFTRREQLPTTGERDINVVANNSLRASLDLDVGPLSGRVSARYVQGRRDLDFNTAGNPQIDYEDFAVVDLSTVYRLTRQHSLSLAVNNLLDTYYYEKLGFPHLGRAFALRYLLDIGRRP
jgi:outer membrane cobalamin receptor